MSFDAFIKVDGIPGESNDSKHPNEIEVLSFHWGVSQTGSTSPGGGGGEGKAEFQDFHFVSRLQKSSPSLFLACATGENIKTAVLTVRRAGGAQQDYYKITFDEVLITKFDQSGEADARENVPIDQTSFHFAKITISYQQQNTKGGVGAPIVVSYDVGSGSSG